MDEISTLNKRGTEIIQNCRKEIRHLNEAEIQEISELKEKISALKDEKAELERSLNQETEPVETTYNMKEFKLIKAISDIANNRNLDPVASAVCSAGKEEMRMAGVSYGGQIQLPTEERAAITVTAEGTDTVATDLYNVMEPLRAKNVLAAAGCKFLTGLVGDVQVPLMAASNVTWEGETAPAQDGAGTFTSVKLSPKRLTAFIDISKQFLIQDSVSAEALIRQDIVNAINTKLEETILGSAAGSTTQPAGIFYTTGTLPTISSFADLCNLESDIEDANITGECKYIMSNKAKAAFRNMPKSSKTTQLVMEGGQIDGTPVLNTSNVPLNGIAYGDWSNLAVGQWGAINATIISVA